jgi:biopolymer transport protein ExbD
MRRIRGRRKRWAGQRHAETGISLTSMMDVLTTLLFFVLKSFVTGGDATAPPPSVSLPKSTAEASMQNSTVIAIDKGSILIGGERITSVSAALADDQMLIEPLANRLRREAPASRDTSAMRKHLVTIQGDQDIEFRLLQKVMYTVNQSGYPDIALAVLKKA